MLCRKVNFNFIMLFEVCINEEKNQAISRIVFTNSDVYIISLFSCFCSWHDR